VLLFGVFAFALTVFPYYFPVEESVASAAAVAGYNNGAAYKAIVIASLLGVVGFGMLGHGQAASAESVANRARVPRVRLNRKVALELTMVVILVALMRWPWFLAKYGPYLEDDPFLSMLHRMQSGQIPYADFEFLYGPLMMAIGHGWMQIAGYSMTSYYGLLAIMEVAQFVVLLLVVKAFFPRRTAAFATFALLALFCLDTFLGMNWNALRRLLPALLMLLAASDGMAWRKIPVTALATGLLLAYTHSYGSACLAAIAAMYALQAVGERKLAPIARAAAFVGLSVAVWFVCVYVVLDGDVFAYVRATMAVISRFGVGEQGFPFRWTVNSIASFALLCLTVASIGQGLKRVYRGTRISVGDFYLLGALVYTLFAVRIGLNRSDIWHLTAPFLPIIVATILPLPRIAFVTGDRAAQFAHVLVVVMAATYFLSLAPTGSRFARGWIGGLRDTVLAYDSADVSVAFRAPTIEPERSHPHPDILALGRYLVDPEHVNRPVLFYANVWDLDKRVGVTNTIYPVDDFLLSDEIGIEVGEFLEDNPDVLVVIGRSAYERLFNPVANPAEQPNQVEPATAMKSVLRVLSTAHYESVEIEYDLKLDRWERTVGHHIHSSFEPIAEFGAYLVLERSAAD
jgi:hypothetical protein